MMRKSVPQEHVEMAIAHIEIAMSDGGCINNFGTLRIWQDQLKRLGAPMELDELDYIYTALSTRYRPSLTDRIKRLLQKRKFGKNPEAKMHRASTDTVVF